MFFKTISIAFTLCTLGYAIPLQKPARENSTQIMSKFFESRIVGGTDAKEGSAPYMVALVVGERIISLACGGSIISHNMVMTAAHCIDIYLIWGELLPSYHGRVGTNFWNRGGFPVHFKAHHLHQQWDWGTLKNDIGLLQLTQDLTWSPTVQKIELSWDIIGGGKESFVNGWGALGAWPDNVIPYALQFLPVSTVSHESCYEVLRLVIGGPGLIPVIDRDVELCTIHSIGHGMCNGDSGSALIEKESRKQIGIVSWGFPCATGLPDVFVRLSGFEIWVKEKMNNYR